MVDKEGLEGKEDVEAGEADFLIEARVCSSREPF